MANTFPGRIIDSVNGLIGKVKLFLLKTVGFNPTNPSLLEFKDQDGNLLDNVNIGIPNIENLQISLDSKVSTIDVISSNGNVNKHKIASIGTVDINETVTKLNPLDLQGNILYIKLVNENGVEQVVSQDFSGLVTTDSSISNATYDASTNIITLTETDGDVFSINLSEFSIIVNTDSNGITTLVQEGSIKATISRVGQTGQWEHILDKPLNFNSNITVRKVLIPISALPANFTVTDIKNWLNANESIGDNEILLFETTADAVIVTLSINILSPIEGQSITGDLSASFEILGPISINIISPIEGENITGDLTASFEIII